MPEDDPFRHHPGLRDRITPFRDSFFRDKTVDDIRALMTAKGIPILFPFHSDDTREGLRRAALKDHDGDLWVFAYGSLIWDPALDFAELRRARAPGHARRFILVDTYGGRGTEDAPGLMAALDEGAGCDGVAFRIEAAKVETETRQLFQRELIGPGYLARFVDVEIGRDTARALTFLADHDDPLMRPDITRTDQVRYAATGTEFLGSSLDYLENTVAHLAEIGIDDPDITALLCEVRAYMAETPEDHG